MCIRDRDRPLIVQFCGNDPDTILQAAKMVENECDAVDLNLGCPQGIARRGHYGSFLLQESDLIVQIVKNLADNLKIPVTVKIRILPDINKTMELAQKIQDAGASMLTVHGRTKEQKKDRTGPCNWDIIRDIKKMLKIPVIANGGIYTFEDVQRCLEYTGCDGVMSSEALLENPTLFSGKNYDLDDVAFEFMELSKLYKNDIKYVKPHLFKILYSGLQKHTDLRDKLPHAKTFEEMLEIITHLKQRRVNEDIMEKLGWYLRYQKIEGKHKMEKEKILQNSVQDGDKLLDEVQLADIFD
eukprot:TRINITY_DN4719_c0_g1_i16.p2 TRINITY_DN4719_c0_g1~~TRINITY_DN4719_c0_g1_i16.p2  ORF type:complete len:298 (+),score=43.45 TRINITY_DN4719_c0_g1_i16:67-960(+)